MADIPTAGTSVNRDTLVEYIDTYLETGEGTDYCPNGLQVEGAPLITRLVTGVSACQELFQRAADAAAEAVLVHHGIFWRGDSPTLTGIQYRRVAALIRRDINLLAYHLPLDRHLEIGNNAVAARRLHLSEIESFCVMEGLGVGVHGRFADAERSIDSVIDQVARLYGRDPLSFPFGPQNVRTVALVSGAGGRCIHQAIAQGADLFVTGEAEEWTMNLAREAEINVIAAGHYATERLGVQALGEHLQTRFGIDVEFVDIPNPV